MRVAAAIAIAAIPGVIAWWWSRTIAARREDPAAPERLAAHRVRVAWLAALTALGIGLFGPKGSWMFSPLVLLASIAGYFPARRAVRGERWRLLGYLRFLSAMALGFFGHTILLTLVPALVPAPGPLRWGVLAVLAGVVVVWSASREAIAQLLLGATVLDRPGLAARCRAIAERAGLRPPRLLRGGPRDGCWPQTVCWADSKRSAVLFSETLLAELDDEELAAMFALDVAFIEHGRRLDKRLELAEAGLIAGAVAIVPVSELVESQLAAAVPLLWPILVIAAQIILSRRAWPAQRDQRAAELLGDVDALVRALSKQNTLDASPRRGLPGTPDEGAGAPLHRRIQALRAGSLQAGPYRQPPTQATPPPALPAIVRGRQQGHWVILEEDLTHWLDGVPVGTAPLRETLLDAAQSTSTHRYGALSRLTLTFGDRGPILVAADRTGKPWNVPMLEEDVSKLQAALDFVEGRLGSASAPPASPLLALGPVALLVGTFAVWTYARGPIALVVPLALALVVRPSSATAGAIGGAAALDLVRRFLQLVGVSSPASMSGVFQRAEVGPGPLIALAALALLCFAWARRRAAEHDEGGKRRVLWVLVPLAVLGGASSAVISCVPWLGGDLPSSAAAALVFAAIAGSSLWPARRRVFAALWAVLAIAGIVWPLVAESEDAEHPDAPLIVEIGDSPAPVVTRVPIGGHAHELRLSPSGARFAVHSRGWRVFERNGARRAVAGEQLEFVDDESILVLETNDEGTVARLLSAVNPDAPPSWERAFRGEVGEALHVDQTTREVAIVTTTQRSTEWVLRRGALVASPLAEKRWVRRPLPATIQEVVTNGRILVEVDRGLSMERGNVTRWERGFVVALRSDSAHRLFSASPSIECSAGPVDRATFLCWSSATRRSVFWQVAPDGSTARPVGAVSGHVSSASLTPDGRVLAIRGREMLLFGPAPRSRLAVKIASFGPMAFLSAVRSAGGLVAAVETEPENQSHVRFWRLPALGAATGRERRSR